MDNFIFQTARDYDLEYHIVESVYKKYGNNTHDFYERLEEIIKERKN